MAGSGASRPSEKPWQTEEYSFKWFAEHSFYRMVNQRLLELAELRPGQRIVELACGTGAVSKLILEKLRGARDSVLIGIDYSAAAIKEAMQQLSGVRDAVVQLIQSRAEELSKVVTEKVDAVVFCNGIHYIPDKDRLVAEVSKTLKPRGVFAFNTSFFHGAHPPETEQFYRRWMMKAIRLLRAEHGIGPDAQQKVESRRQLTPEQYRELMRQHGLTVAKEEVQTAPVSLQGWIDISRFEDFAEGALPGVPLEKASRALQTAVRLIMDEMGIDHVPRNWLEVVAVKA